MNKVNKCVVSALAWLVVACVCVATLAAGVFEVASTIILVVSLGQCWGYVWDLHTLAREGAK